MSKKKKNKRKICVFSGKRGGFGSLIRTMDLIKKDPDLELQLVVTDMHLSNKFGKTLYEVEKSFRVNEKINMKQKSGQSVHRSEAIGECLKGSSKVLKKLRPNIFLGLGDRGEILAAMIAANNLHIPVAHVQGGDISGNLDEIFRHAMTKLSHIHFPSTEESARRIEKMGEEKWRIHVVGDTHLDLIANKQYTTNAVVRKKFGLSTKGKYLMVLQHPVNTEPKKSYEQMKNTLEAVMEISLPAVIVYPCSDQGYEGIIKAINDYKGNKKFKIYKNIDAPDFLGLMEGTEVLIGNSSSGIIEAPMFKLPVVNIGDRQKGRLRDFNIIDIQGKNKKEIFNAIRYAMFNKEFKESLKNCGQIYGEGKAAEKIVEILKNIKIDEKLLKKRMTY